MKAPKRATTQSIGFPLSALHAYHKIWSLLKKPALMNGNAARAAEPAKKVQNITGILSFNPPILKMLCSWCKDLITAPAARNNKALKNACVKKWKIAALHAPTPRARNIYPIWLMVEYASTLLMSVCTIALQPATNKVRAPTTAVTSIATGDNANKVCILAIK